MEFEMGRLRPAWVEIDTDAIKANFAAIRRQLGPKQKVMAVVKANAYEHGALVLAPLLLDQGADALGVAILDEALELRQAGITAPILVFGPTEATHAETLVAQGIDQTVFSYEAALALSQAAQKLGKPARIHIAIDSGMGRIGFLPSPEAVDEIVRILNLPGLTYQGLFTHFATADEADKTYTQMQVKRFEQMRQALEGRGYVAKVTHTANSAATIDLPDTYYDMARPGIIIYGIYPSDHVQQTLISLAPAMKWKARITHVKTLAGGESISYGRHYTTDGPRKIATLPIGYEDGYTRLFSNKAEVLIHGQRAPVVGSICMDQCMVDVTDIPDVCVGDEVVLLGKSGDDTISAEELARLIGTIPYEIVVMASRRLPRVYLSQGQVVKVTSDLVAYT